MSVNHLRLWYPPTTVHPSQLHAPLPPGYTSGNPDPVFTTQTPSELLEKFYSNRRNDPDWTDPKGPLKKPHNAVKPNGSRGSVGDRGRPNGLAAEPVPVRVELGEPQLAVEFRNLNRECPSTGIAVRDLFAGSVNLMAGAKDIVFDGFRGMDLNFIIAWPGYSPLSFSVSTVADNVRPLMRYELGRKIAMTYIALFDAVEMEGVLSTGVDFFNIALRQGRHSRSAAGVQVRQLHLVRLRGTIGGNWVADVDIV